MGNMALQGQGKAEVLFLRSLTVKVLTLPSCHPWKQANLIHQYLESALAEDTFADLPRHASWHPSALFLAPIEVP